MHNAKKELSNLTLCSLETNTWREPRWAAYFSASYIQTTQFPILRMEYNLTSASSWTGIPVLSKFDFSSIAPASLQLLNAAEADMKATFPEGPLTADFQLASANGKC